MSDQTPPVPDGYIRCGTVGTLPTPLPWASHRDNRVERLDLGGEWPCVLEDGHDPDIHMGVRGETKKNRVRVLWSERALKITVVTP